MPPVVGLLEASAVEQLRLRDLDVQVVHVVATPPGRVLHQDPEAGTRLAPGAAATIHVGIEAYVQTIVPDVSGQTIDVVRGRLERVYVLEFVEVPGPAHYVGRVLRQSPAPNARHPFRGVLRLEVVQAPRLIPNVVGQNAHVARRLLRRAGLRAEVRRVTEPHVVDGLVLAQEPPAGAEIVPGVRVVLRVATHDVIEDRTASAVPCPDLSGLSLAQAYNALLACGLQPHPQFQASPSGRVLGVLSQLEAAGTGLPPGAHVHFTVAQRPLAAHVPIELPSFLGALMEEARDLANALGLRTRVQPQPSQLPPGTVLAMRPTAGSQVSPNAEVTLLVAAKAPFAWGSGNVRMPDLRGRSMETARRALFGLGLDAQVVAGIAPNAPLDQVTGQRPAPGQRVAPGQAVQIYLPLAVVVPDVNGQRLRRAQARMEAAGLQVEVRGQGEVAVRGSRVVRTRPPAGTRIAKGSVIRMRVEPAVAPADPRPGFGRRIIVPSFKGMGLPQAQARAEALGLRVGIVDSPAARGRAVVISQTIRPGEVVAAGTEITLRLQWVVGTSGVDVRVVTVPNVTNKTRAEASEVLRALGLEVGVRGIDVKVGRLRTKVRNQRPAPGTEVEAGSKVIITLGF